jgi:hypothetical protein
MKTLTCYFCNSIINNPNYCNTCKDKYDLEYVYTGYIDDKNNGDLKLYYSEIEVYINKIIYGIELKFIDWDTYAPVNDTKIYRNRELILTLPGCPFTPANIKDKLKSYILFS